MTHLTLSAGAGLQGLALALGLALFGCSEIPPPSGPATTGEVAGQARGCGGSHGGCACGRMGDAQLTFTSEALTETERQALTLQHQEERVSRALYDTFAGEDHVFSHVAGMEQGHRDWLAEALRAHGNEAPDAEAPLDAAHGERLAALVARGKTSRGEALRVAVENEEADIARLARLSAEATHPDIQRLFQRLGSDSAHHRMMFARHGGR